MANAIEKETFQFFFRACSNSETSENTPRNWMAFCTEVGCRVSHDFTALLKVAWSSVDKDEETVIRRAPTAQLRQRVNRVVWRAICVRCIDRRRFKA